MQEYKCERERSDGGKTGANTRGDREKAGASERGSYKYKREASARR
jgi:hypothetical protein